MVAIGSRTHYRSRSKQFTFLLVSLGAVALLFAFRPDGRDSFSDVPSSERKIRMDQRATTTISSSETDYKESEDGKQQENRIRQISLLGERNSGTRWSYEHLNACFNHSITVRLLSTMYDVRASALKLSLLICYVLIVHSHAIYCLSLCSL